VVGVTRRRQLRDEVLVAEHPDRGRMLLVLPTIPDHAPYVIREGIARRRIAATTGRCPCGATVDYDAAVAGKVNIAEVHHEARCPAATEKLVKAVRRWAR